MTLKFPSRVPSWEYPSPNFSDIFAPFRPADTIRHMVDFDISGNQYRFTLEWNWTISEIGYLKAVFFYDDLLGFPQDVITWILSEEFKRIWRRTRFVEPEPHIILGEN